MLNGRDADQGSVIRWVSRLRGALVPLQHPAGGLLMGGSEAPFKGVHVVYQQPYLLVTTGYQDFVHVATCIGAQQKNSVTSAKRSYETWEWPPPFCPAPVQILLGILLLFTQPPCKTKTSDGWTAQQMNHGQRRPCYQHKSCFLSSIEVYRVNRSAVFITV
jgi:hypothetical protein